MITAPPLKWHGGKYFLAERIISIMPSHRHYVEPFFGGGAVLLRKGPEGISEVVNDIYRELTIFWKVLQAPELFEQLKRRLEATPFSEIEFEESKYESQNEFAVDIAAAFFIRYRQSRQGLGKDFATLSRNRTRRNMNEQASSWLSTIEGLQEAHERLQRVVILNRDAKDVILQQDGQHTLFYCDPPYLHETRTAKQAYHHEMTSTQHCELLAILSQVMGKFILSGYHSLLYDGWATSHNWHCLEIPIDNKASGAAIKPIKVECLWTNYKPL